MSSRQLPDSVNRTNDRTPLRNAQPGPSRGENPLLEAADTQVVQAHHAQLRRVDSETNAIGQKRNTTGAQANGGENEMHKNRNILLNHIELFHDETMNQLATHEANLDSIHTEQIHRWDEFSEQLEDLQTELDEKHEIIDEELRAHREEQEEEHETVIEKLDQVLGEHRGLDKFVVHKLQEVQNAQEVLYETLMVEMSGMHKSQTGILNSMVKLSDTQEKLSIAGTKQLDLLEDMVYLRGGTSFATQGSTTDNGAPAKLQSHMLHVACNPSETIIGTSNDTPGQPAKINTDGTLSCLLEFLLPLLVVSCFATLFI